MSLPTDSKARKAIPMFSGLLKYFPLALAAVAKHSHDGNEQHNPGEPLHWAREKSNDHCDCIVRHITDYAKGDKKAMIAVAWRALAQAELDEEENAQAVRDLQQRDPGGENDAGAINYGPFPCRRCSFVALTPAGLCAHHQRFGH